MIAASLAGCRSATDSGSDTVLLEARRISEMEVFHHSSDLLEPVRSVIRSPQAWQAVWEPNEPRFPVPAIKFSSDMLVVAAAGVRPGAAYSIHVDSVFVRSESTFVAVTEYNGSSTCGTTFVPVQPIDVVAVEARPEPVLFLEHGKKERICE